MLVEKMIPSISLIAALPNTAVVELHQYGLGVSKVDSRCDLRREFKLRTR